MDNTLLRAKHWMLFIPLAGATIYQYALQGNITRYTQEWSRPGADFDLENLKIVLEGTAPYWYAYLGLFLLAMAVNVLWTYSVVTRLNPHAPEGARIDLAKFRGFWTAYVVFYLGFITFAFVMIPKAFNYFFSLSESAPAPEELMSNFFTYFSVFFILSLLIFALQVYLAYAAAKTIKSIEDGQAPRGAEVVGYTFLSYLLIIGIWLLQPKVNRYVETGSMAKPGDDSTWG